MIRAFFLWLLTTLVHGYRFFFSPWVGRHCRFTPTCSAYALQALQQHGPVGGAYLATRRVLRCHPGCPGGHDPVPAQWRFSLFSSQDKH
jgi:uncharacterized protein